MPLPLPESRSRIREIQSELRQNGNNPYSYAMNRGGGEATGMVMRNGRLFLTNGRTQDNALYRKPFRVVKRRQVALVVEKAP